MLRNECDTLTKENYKIIDTVLKVKEKIGLWYSLFPFWHKIIWRYIPWLIFENITKTNMGENQDHG